MRRPPNLMKSMPPSATLPVRADPEVPANYLDLYGLATPPFSGAPDHGGYILFASHRRVFEPLIEHVVNGSGLVLLQGEEGIGKTETLRAVATVATESGVQPVLVSRPPNGRISLVQLVSAVDGQASAEAATVDEAIARFVMPPRRALLADDIDLMPADCIHFLATLAQCIAKEPGGPAMVLTTSTDLISDLGARSPEVGPRSSSHNAVDAGDKQATENKEPVARKWSSPDMADSRFGTLDAKHPLIQRQPVSAGLKPSDAVRPELSQLASLAVNVVRLPPLGAAEIRQYIERSLWVAGGTTRRLIASDAMKLLVARSSGVPGITNRLMEAVLTAGFARGDMMINAKTVNAAMGPTAPRPPPRHRSPQPSGTPARAMQVAAVGLLVLGASAFLYRGLSDKPDQGSPPKPIVSSAPRVVAPPTERSLATALAGSLPPELMAALMKHGDQSLGLGDVAAARLLYRRAADAGSGPAATALGKTYDPNFASPGANPDPASAAGWYRKAIELGDPHAADLLAKLGAH